MTTSTMPDQALGIRVMDLIEELAQYTDEPGRLTRLYLSKAHRATADATLRMMQTAGMAAHMDAVGNVVGRYEAATPGAPTLIIGSHLDSVVDAGRFDGPLGVVSGIVAVETLKARSVRLPFAVEVVAFGDEENVRFPTNLSTSYALAGRYNPAWLDSRDEHGVSLREALVAFGGNPDGIAELARNSRNIIGYLEVHIEQGPVLERENLPIGIVSAINGVSRARLRVTGEAGHAGTVPMPMRRDALAATAEMICAVERIGATRTDTVATVGAATVRPNAVNVIPAQVDFTLDARSPDDVMRHTMVADIMTECEAIAVKRGVSLTVEPFMDSPATRMDADLSAALEEAARGLGVRPLRLASGAGHDAVAMATLCPSAMLFVRCKDGISHNPAESITAEDAGIAVEALIRALTALGSRPAA